VLFEFQIDVNLLVPPPRPWHQTMMATSTRLLQCMLLLLSLAFGSVVSSKILVVYDATFEKADYSTFFTLLEGKGNQVTFRSTKDTSPALVSYEEKVFDSVFLFAPTSRSE
jgi:oligosaccharyltransferase complex subunit beta